MQKPIVDIITLGCSKNLVDSEKLLFQLQSQGYEVHHDPEVLTGEIAVINTCGFIGDAKEESVNMILEVAARKETGKLKKLYVMGCLSERYFKELNAEIPEVDKFYGKFDWTELVNDLGKFYQVEHRNDRVLTTPSHYAYLKVSEGCDRHCAYCAIPIITGKHKSRAMEDIVAEVKLLIAQGVKEFQIIAQELTYYGIDLYKKRMIAELIKAIAEVEGVKWIRLHYAYPTDFPEELLMVMRDEPKVCKYLDIALQHISTPVLGRMRRNIDSQKTYELVDKIRQLVPGIHLRTTMMVGFPGETEEDFNELLEFVKYARFERLGAFAYSEEDGTYAADNYQDDVPEDVKEARLSKLMRVQQRISSEIQDSKVGLQLQVVVDRIEGDYYVARTEYDSPEVDPEVLIKTSQAELEIGEFYNVMVDSADDFDLYAHVVSYSN